MSWSAVSYIGKVSDNNPKYGVRSVVTHHEGVPLASIYLDRIDSDRLVVDGVNLDDRHVVIVD